MNAVFAQNNRIRAFTCLSQPTEPTIPELKMIRFCLLTCLLLSFASTALAQGRAQADQNPSARAMSQQRFEATLQRSTEMRRLDLEFELKRLELESQIAIATAEDAQAMVSLAELQLARARENGEGYGVAAAEIELQRAKIRTKAQQLRREVASLQLERAKTHVKREFENMDKKSRAKATAPWPMPERDEPLTKPVPVQFEVLEGAKSVLIRGPRASVQRVRQMMEAAAKANQ